MLTVNIVNAPVRTMYCAGTKNAHKAAGNLLISANYLSRGTSGGLKGFVSAHERSKIELVTFCSAESKTNKDGDNGAQENGNLGGWRLSLLPLHVLFQLKGHIVTVLDFSIRINIIPIVNTYTIFFYSNFL